MVKYNRLSMKDLQSEPSRRVQASTDFRGEEVVINLPWHSSTSTRLHELYHAEYSPRADKRKKSKVNQSTWDDWVADELEAEEFSQVMRSKEGINYNQVSNIGTRLIVRGFKPAPALSLLERNLERLGYSIKGTKYKTELWNELKRDYRDVKSGKL